MNVIGVRRLPCGHHRVRPPAEVGRYERRCATCKTTFTLTVEQSADLTVKCGKPVLVAHWQKQEAAA